MTIKKEIFQSLCLDNASTAPEPAAAEFTTAAEVASHVPLARVYHVYDQRHDALMNTGDKVAAMACRLISEVAKAVTNEGL